MTGQFFSSGFIPTNSLLTYSIFTEQGGEFLANAGNGAYRQIIRLSGSSGVTLVTMAFSTPMGIALSEFTERQITSAAPHIPLLLLEACKKCFY